jgi:hypothetical protein
MFGKFIIIFASEIPGRILGELVHARMKIAKIYCLWAEGPERSKFTCIFQVLGSLSISMQLSFFANTNPCNGNQIVIINNCWVEVYTCIQPLSHYCQFFAVVNTSEELSVQ